MKIPPLAAAILVLVSGAALAAPPADLPPYDFFAGDYAVVGRPPGGGAAYAGSARISVAKDGLVLRRSTGGEEKTFHGRFEGAAGGETQVLLFREPPPGALVISCVFASDPDNYPRLACLWGPGGERPAAPGLETWFPEAGSGTAPPAQAPAAKDRPAPPTPQSPY